MDDHDSQTTAAERFTAAAHHRRAHGKGSHALILKAADALPAKDRALIQAVYADGRSTAELARLRGLRPRQLSYRVRMLALRVLSPEYAFVLANRRHWSRSRAKVATVCFIQGRSIREAARLTRLSFHTARHHHDTVLALMSAAAPPRRRRPEAPVIYHADPTPLNSQRGAA